MAVTYSQTNTALYLDGVLATNGGGFATIPAADYFSIGDNDYDDYPATGWFDELDTFNYQLSPERIYSPGLSGGSNRLAKVGNCQRQ